MPLRKDIKKVLVIGSGPIVIGQAAEFDYAGTQACLALKEEGLEVVLLNNNPATIMTDETIADRIYIEPLTLETVEEIIKKERPDGMIGTLGGQTGLNLTVQLAEAGILDKYGVKLLGTSVESIKKGEDRELFRQLMLEIGEPIPESRIIHSVEEGIQFVEEIGLPIIIRPAYTLGGSGGGFVYHWDELEGMLKKGLAASPIHQVLVERSIKGWKEVEYEVMRDANDTCIIVCNMENMDPVGVHTGDSIVVAPSQTLTDRQYQMLRDASLKVIRSLDVIGGCNIQFALDPKSDRYFIIEVNPRVSRSSALASKATGYPIARMAAKCAIGYHLDELINPITGSTYASFEPSLDYIVVKLPRFPFDKFGEADRRLGTQMKATGEVMAIDRTFEGALNKGLRSLEMNVSGLALDSLKGKSREELNYHLVEATDLRLFAIAEVFRQGAQLDEVHQLTGIDPWFLGKIKGLIELEKKLASFGWEELPTALLVEAKQKNLGDQYLAKLFQVPERKVRARRKELGLRPVYKQVDTCAAEFEAVASYYYSTWLGECEVEPTKEKKVVVLGSGPIRIGQGIEFDYCSVHAALALKKKGYKAIVINNNPETVSTDYSIADRLYFEPLAVEDILHVLEKEQAEGVLIQFGGQTAINVAAELKEEGIPILGTTLEAIDKLEDRQQFYDLLQSLGIPHIAGRTVNHPEELKQAAQELGFPVLVRPSYVIGGQAMFIFHQADELDSYVQQLEERRNSKEWPLLIDKYVPGLECEMDVISDGEELIIPGIFEHIEQAGVHSGDSITIFPSISLSPEIKNRLVDYARRIALEVPIIGMMNIQFVVADDQVYVLEVNPRSSRTVPIMSKVTRIPMVEWGTRVQLGEKLTDLSTQLGLLPEPDFYAVKAPIFSASKLKEVDHVLGPEMKSTGEILGLGRTKEEALEKALFLGAENPFIFPETSTGENLSETPSQTDNQCSLQHRPIVFCSISDREKERSLPILREIYQRGFKLLATPGTKAYLAKHGLVAEEVARDKGEIMEHFKRDQIVALINSPNQGRVKDKFGFFIREQATKYMIPCYTCLDTVKAALSISGKEAWQICALTEYYQRAEKLIERV